MTVPATARPALEAHVPAALPEHGEPLGGQ